jgi:cob(I)alamin adenosyltransferase
MFGRRVAKTHPRVDAYGTVDELNAALGFVRATATDPWVNRTVEAIQHELVGLMGELAVDDQDHRKYEESGFDRVTPEQLAKLDGIVARLEGENIRFEGWSTPGGSLHSAALDLARTTCRRSERKIWRLIESDHYVNRLSLKYLNRLSDILWLLARKDETAGSCNA